VTAESLGERSAHLIKRPRMRQGVRMACAASLFRQMGFRSE